MIWYAVLFFVATTVWSRLAVGSGDGDGKKAFEYIEWATYRSNCWKAIFLFTWDEGEVRQETVKNNKRKGRRRKWKGKAYVCLGIKIGYIGESTHMHIHLCIAYPFSLCFMFLVVSFFMMLLLLSERKQRVYVVDIFFSYSISYVLCERCVDAEDRK